LAACEHGLSLVALGTLGAGEFEFRGVHVREGGLGLEGADSRGAVRGLDGLFFTRTGLGGLFFCGTVIRRPPLATGCLQAGGWGLGEPHEGAGRLGHVPTTARTVPTLHFGDACFAGEKFTTGGVAGRVTLADRTVCGAAVEAALGAGAGWVDGGASVRVHGLRGSTQTQRPAAGQYCR
jgi:hypothetical protein